MATISELVVKIVADTANFDKGIKSTTDSLDKAGESSKGAVGQFENLKDALVSAGLIAAFVAVGKAIWDSVEAFAEAELAAKRLDAVATMRGLGDGADRISELADEIQNLTGVDGDLVVQLGAELIAQGKSIDQTEEMIRAASELSAMTGTTLDTSVKQLTGTYSGMAGQLGKTIPELKELTEEELKNGDAVDVIIEKYGGLAAQLTDTTDVAINRATESMGDMKEIFGEAFAPTIIAGANALTDAINAMKPTFEYMATHSFSRMFQELYEKVTGTKEAYTLWEEAMVDAKNAEIEANRVTASRVAGMKALQKDISDTIQKTKDMATGDLKAARDFLFTQMQRTTSMDQLTQAQKKLDEYDKELAARRKAEAEEVRLAKKAAADQAALDAAEAAAREAAARIAKEAETHAAITASEDAIAQAKADAYGDSIIESAKERDQRIADTDAMAAKMQVAFEYAIDATASSFQALGEALATGEDAWKALAKAAINSIAGIVKALGDELAAKAAAALVEAIAALAGVVTAPAAPGLFARAAVLAGGAGAAWTASGALTGYAGSFARGTDFAPGGLSQVNEEGPEMMDVPRGTKITPATRTPSTGAGGGVSVTINSPVAVTPSEAAAIFTRTARNLAFEGVL